SKIANAAVLSDAETQAILNRLPQIKSEPNDEAQFALREKSLPPPRTGAIVMQVFPAPDEMAAPGQPTAGPLEVLRYLPEGDVPMFVEFDQRIDPQAVLKHIKLRAGTNQISIRPATKEELDADENVKELAKNAGKDRWLAFRAIDAKGETKLALPADSAINVSIGPGTPSAEGPLKTEKEQLLTFRAYGELRMVKSQCGNNQSCGPADPWFIQFSNNLDPALFQESQIHIDPPVEGFSAFVSGSSLTLQGAKKPNTKYRVTIDKTLKDQFDQTLGKDETAEFKVGSTPPWISLSGQGLVVLDPAGPRQVLLYSVNYQTVKITLRAVEPEDWL